MKNEKGKYEPDKKQIQYEIYENILEDNFKT